MSEIWSLTLHVQCRSVGVLSAYSCVDHSGGISEVCVDDWDACSAVIFTQIVTDVDAIRFVCNEHPNG